MEFTCYILFYMGISFALFDPTLRIIEGFVYPMCKKDEDEVYKYLLAKAYAKKRLMRCKLLLQVAATLLITYYMNSAYAYTYIMAIFISWIPMMKIHFSLRM